MRPLSMHSVPMESVKGLCWLQHTGVQIQASFRAMAIWPWTCRFPGICNQVPGESGKTGFLLLSLSTPADDPSCMRHFCVENWVTKHPNKILCKQRKPSVHTKEPDCVAGQTTVTMVLRNTTTLGKGRTDPLGGNFLFLWFDNSMWMMCYSMTMAYILSQRLHIAAPAPAELITSGEGELNANPLRAHLS